MEKNESEFSHKMRKYFMNLMKKLREETDLEVWQPPLFTTEILYDKNATDFLTKRSFTHHDIDHKETTFTYYLN